MALNSGYDRYEGPAYFGYEMEGDGHDAIVVIGENLIEIRDNYDRPLSQWIAGSYTTNGEDIPYRAYFHGTEWLAPLDDELRSHLDQFLVPEAKPKDAPKRKNYGWMWAVGILAAMAVLSFFALRPLTTQLLSPAIRTTLDEKIVDSMNNPYELCFESLSETTHDKIISKSKTEDFIVVPTFAQNYARLPSGKIVINAEYLLYIGGAESLASLLQLAEFRNTQGNPAEELLARFPVTNRVTFLANAEVDPEKLEEAWMDYAQSESFSASLYNEVSDPIGDYQTLAEKLGWEEGEYPSEPAGIILTDEEWNSLFSFCEASS